MFKQALIISTALAIAAAVPAGANAAVAAVKPAIAASHASQPVFVSKKKSVDTGNTTAAKKKKKKKPATAG